MSALSESPLELRKEWKPFGIVDGQGEPPMAYKRGELVILSGCITTTEPMKNKAGFDLPIAYIDHRNAPSPPGVSFFAPTSFFLPRVLGSKGARVQGSKVPRFKGPRVQGSTLGSKGPSRIEGSK